MMNGISKDYMLRLKIPKMSEQIQDFEREQVVLAADLSAEDIDKVTHQKNAKLKLTFYNEEEKIQGGESAMDEDGEVMENYYRVKVAEALKDGVKLADQG